MRVKRLLYYALAPCVYYFASGWRGVYRFSISLLGADFALRLFSVHDMVVLTLAEAAILVIIAGALIPRSRNRTNRARR